MGRLASGFVQAVRIALQRETLPPPPPAEPSRSAPGRGALSLLLAPDPFPGDLPPARRRPSRWLSWLFSPEPLDP